MQQVRVIRLQCKYLRYLYTAKPCRKLLLFIYVLYVYFEYYIFNLQLDPQNPFLIHSTPTTNINRQRPQKT